MEYHVLIPFFVIAALVLASELSGVTADEIGGLVGHWDFDDGTGADRSGNGNHAVLGGAKIYSLGEGHACIERCEDEPCGFRCLKTPRLRCRAAQSVSGSIRYPIDPTFSGITTTLSNLTPIVAVFRCVSEVKRCLRYWEGILDYDWAPLRHARMGVLSTRESHHRGFRMASVRGCL